MLKVYIDDSGKADHSPSQILAGYLASDHAWGLFSEEWRSILKSHEIDEFHTYDVWKVTKKSGLRSPLQQSVLLVQIIECIKKYIDHAFVISIPFEAHSHWFAFEANKDLKALRPYRFAFWGLMCEVYLYAWKHMADKKVEVIFDRQGGESEREVLEGFDGFQALCADSFPGMAVSKPVFYHGNDCPPLQAADFLAWLVRRDAHNGFHQIDRERAEEAMFLAQALSMPHTIKVWTDEALEKAATDTAARLLTSIKSGAKY